MTAPKTTIRVSAYEFDEAGRLIHLAVYLQTRLPPGAEQSASWDLESVGAA